MTYRGRLEGCPVKRGDTWARCWRCRCRIRRSWPLHSSAGVVPRPPCCRRWAPHSRRWAPRWPLGAPGRTGRGRGASSELSAPDSPACRSSAQLFLLPCTQQRVNSLYYTDKKERNSFLTYEEIQKGAVAKSYITDGLLIYDRSHLNFLIYSMGKFSFLFYPCILQSFFFVNLFFVLTLLKEKFTQ
jgi:hypothetical protein